MHNECRSLWTERLKSELIVWISDIWFQTRSRTNSSDFRRSFPNYNFVERPKSVPIEIRTQFGSVCQTGRSVLGSSLFMLVKLYLVKKMTNRYLAFQVCEC